MKQLTPFAISAPGFYGLNIQDSPVDMSPNFALVATNCVIDKSGRVASRKGWAKVNAANVDLAISNIESIGELVTGGGASYILAAGGGFLFTLSGSTLTTLTYGGGGVAPTITANNWKIVTLNNVAIFWQRGYDPLIFEPAVSTTTFRRLSERSGYVGTAYQCHVACSAFGRVWAADNGTDKNTVTFSDVIAPHVWSGGTAGTLDLTKVWRSGGDSIVAIASHNNFLIIFGVNETLIYQGADDPATMSLADSIVGVGCIARDSVQNTGDDVIFLSNKGVVSLRRTIQEKSAPMAAISKNVLEEIQSHSTSENMALVKSVYSAVEGFYLLVMPTFNETYCFDTKTQLQDGSLRTTTWTGLSPKCFYEASNRKLYIGKAGYIGQYSGYLDDTATYRMSYYSTWIDFGNPIQTSILKKINLTCIGANNQTLIFKWAYDFSTNYYSQSKTIASEGVAAEFGIAEFGIGEFGGGGGVSILGVNGSSSGRLLQFGFETDISNNQVSIQKVEVFTKEGRI